MAAEESTEQNKQTKGPFSFDEYLKSANFKEAGAGLGINIQGTPNPDGEAIQPTEPQNGKGGVNLNDNFNAYVSELEANRENNNPENKNESPDGVNGNPDNKDVGPTNENDIPDNKNETDNFLHALGPRLTGVLQRAYEQDVGNVETAQAARQGGGGIVSHILDFEGRKQKKSVKKAKMQKRIIDAQMAHFNACMGSMDTSYNQYINAANQFTESFHGDGFSPIYKSKRDAVIEQVNKISEQLKLSHEETWNKILQNKENNPEFEQIKADMNDIVDNNPELNENYNNMVKNADAYQKRFDEVDGMMDKMSKSGYIDQEFVDDFERVSNEQMKKMNEQTPKEGKSEELSGKLDQIKQSMEEAVERIRASISALLQKLGL